MKSLLCLALLALGALPLAAQPNRVEDPSRKFPPDIVPWAPKDEALRDIVRIAQPHNLRVELENDRTRVLRLTLGAGEFIPAHDDRAGVLVCIDGCHLRFLTQNAKISPNAKITPNGKMVIFNTQDVELKAGETRWMTDAQRFWKNLGTKPVEMLYIESKPPAT